MAREIPQELREEARDLYIIEGLTLEETAGRTGISVQSLKLWSASEEWTEQRRLYRRDMRDIKRKTVELKKRLVEKALESLDPQVIYALSRLESATKGKKPQGSALKPGTPRRELSEEAKKKIREEIYGLL